MHPKINQKLFLFIQATIFSIYFPTFLCKNNTIIYPALVPKCSDEPFNCGSIRWYISYPFWGGSRSEECGREGFELVCRAGVPMLNISSLSYRVQQIDFNTYTLNVAREDLQNNICPKVLHNTTIDLKPFKYPLSSNDKKVTLYFNCTSDQYQLETLPNKFTCDVNNVKRAETINLFKTGDASSGPGSNITCNNNIFVPIKQEAAQSLENLSASSINILQSALASGFSIQWSPDVVQYFAAVCNSHVYDHCLSEVQGSNAAKNLSEVIVIVVALTTIIVVVVSIIIHIFLKRRHSASGPNQRRNQNVRNFLLQHGSLTPTRYRYSEIKKITKSFSDKLGQGGYGTVYKGMLPEGSPVAVKVLIETNSNGEEFINEVASISRTSHVNIISLLGFCYEGNRRALIYEFMPNKSLDKFLNNNGSAANADCGLDLEKLYEIAVGIAKGLEYLHTGCSTRIVHFDIKPQNILLDEDFCPKISDFGLAKLCKRKQSILSELGTRGTIGYIAPELFSRTFGGVSHKSDVYSYGMMVLEMAGARKIVENEVAQSSENYFPDKIYEQIILNVAWKSNNSMTEDEEAIARKMFLVGFWCIQITPSERPSMSRVVEMLEGSIQSIEIPPKPFLFSPLPGQKNSFSFSTYTETENSAQDNGVLLLRSDTTNQCIR